MVRFQQATLFYMRIFIGLFFSLLPLAITNDYFDLYEDYELTEDVLCNF